MSNAVFHLVISLFVTLGIIAGVLLFIPMESEEVVYNNRMNSIVTIINNGGEKEDMATATGTFIGPHTILTVSHVLYNEGMDLEDKLSYQTYDEYQENPDLEDLLDVNNQVKIIYDGDSKDKGGNDILILKTKENHSYISNLQCQKMKMNDDIYTTIGFKGIAGRYYVGRGKMNLETYKDMGYMMSLNADSGQSGSPVYKNSYNIIGMVQAIMSNSSMSLRGATSVATEMTMVIPSTKICDIIKENNIEIN